MELSEPAWARPGGVYVELRRAAAQSINNNTLTAISWDTEDSDDDGFIAVTATTLTVPTGLGGLYLLDGSGNFANSFTGRALFEFVAGGITYRQGESFTTENAGRVAMSPVPLDDGDTVVMNVLQSAGAANNFTGRLYVARLSG